MSAPEWGDKGKGNQNDPVDQYPEDYFKIKSKPALLILIGGPSGSGKGELAKQIQEKSIRKVTLLPTDNYCRKTEKPINFASPDTFNKTKLLQDLETLKGGNSVTYPNHLHPDNNAFYEGDIKSIAEKMGKEFTAEPSEIIIAEGYHSLQCPELRNMADLKIYAYAAPDNLLMWKIKRGPWYKKLIGEEAKDPRNFGNNIVEAFDRWVNSSRISSKKYIEPTKQHADLVVVNDSREEFDRNVEKIVNFIYLYFENKEEFKRKLEESKEESSDLETKIKNLEKQLATARSTELTRERESNYLLNCGRRDNNFSISFISNSLVKKEVQTS